MPDTTLIAETGRTSGTSQTRRLRADGKIPGVVYGHGSQPVSVAVEARDFRVAMSGDAGLNTLLTLDLDGKSVLALARDIQRHPVRNVVTHVDFLIVRRDEVIAAEVSINLVGDPVEIHHADGIVDQQLFTLAVKAKPADIPNSVNVDISNLTIGGSLHVRDIAVASGVEVETDPETTVVAGLPPRVQIGSDEGEGEGEASAEPTDESAPGTSAGDAQG